MGILEAWRLSRERRLLSSQGNEENMSDADDDGQDTFVWGTNLAIASVTRRIRDFFTSYYGDMDPAGGEAKYQALLRQVSRRPCTTTTLHTDIC